MSLIEPSRKVRNSRCRCEAKMYPLKYNQLQLSSFGPGSSDVGYPSTSYSGAKRAGPGSL